ncbi:MAG: hypothetical protein HQL90_09510 [Magnetococcales bacterium]|nr:hypothetical protein [Magnetococcales bacterium]
MNGFKPGQRVRRLAQVASFAWWRRNKKSALSSDSQGRFFGRSKSFAQKVDINPPSRSTPLEGAVARRGAILDYKWGLLGRELLMGLVEKAILLVVGSFILLKNGLGFVRDLWLSGRELVVRRFVPDTFSFATFEREVLEGRMQQACQVLEKQPNRGQVGGRDPAAVMASLQSYGLREEVERAKISFLDTEEEDLPEDVLEDQAGALRSRLAAAAQEEIKR